MFYEYAILCWSYKYNKRLRWYCSNHNRIISRLYENGWLNMIGGCYEYTPQCIQTITKCSHNYKSYHLHQPPPFINRYYQFYHYILHLLSKKISSLSFSSSSISVVVVKIAPKVVALVSFQLSASLQSFYSYHYHT